MTLSALTQKTILTTLALASLTVLAWRACPAEANDLFANRLLLSGTNLTVTGSNTNATKENGEPNHAGNSGGKSVWWTWTAPTDGEVQITTDGSSFDTLLGVYTGSRVMSLTLVASNDDHGPFVTSRVRFPVRSGTAYSIAVDGYNDGNTTDFGVINLTLAFTPGPITRRSNDNFANRTPLIGLTVTVTNSNVEATREPGEPLHANQPGDTSVWWTWTAPVSGTFTLTTTGSAFDTLLAVYQGTSWPSLTHVASNDDTDPANGVLTSIVTFEAAAGQAYQIAVDGFDGAWGRIVLNLGRANPSLGAPVRLSNGAFRFTILGVPGRIYEVQAGASLGGWVPIGNVVMTHSSESFTDTSATNQDRRVYRAFLISPPLFP